MSDAAGSGIGVPEPIGARDADVTPGPEEPAAREDPSADLLLGCVVAMLLLCSLGTGAIMVWMLVSLAGGMVR